MHIAKRFSHSRFFEWIRDHGITFSAGVPTVLNMLLNKPLGYTAKDVPTLRLMSCSHRAAHRAAMAASSRRCTASSCCSSTACRRPAGCAATATTGNKYRHRRSAGAAPGARDRRRRRQGHARSGSRARSPPAARRCAIGYLLDDGSIEPIRGNRIKTGDLGIMDEDGFVRVTGRTKDLIIRGGVNIAPLEIDEIAAASIPASSKPPRVGVPDKIYGEEVVCYVVAEARGADRGRRRSSTAGRTCRRQDAEAGCDRRRTCPRAIAARCCATGCGKTGSSGAKKPAPDITGASP